MKCGNFVLPKRPKEKISPLVPPPWRPNLFPSQRVPSQMVDPTPPYVGGHIFNLNFLLSETGNSMWGVLFFLKKISEFQKISTSNYQNVRKKNKYFILFYLNVAIVYSTVPLEYVYRTCDARNVGQSCSTYVQLKLR